jgi:hypothetical protein
MVTAEMRRIANAVTRKYRNNGTYGTLMLASVDGPECWRGCIDVTEYRPEYKPGQWRTMAEHRRKHPRKLRERDIFEEYGEYVRNH